MCMCSPAPSPEHEARYRHRGENSVYQHDAKENSRHENDVQIRRAVPVGFAHLGLNPREIHVVNEECDNEERERDAQPMRVPSSQEDEADEGDPPEALGENMIEHRLKNLHGVCSGLTMELRHRRRCPAVSKPNDQPQTKCRGRGPRRAAVVCRVGAGVAPGAPHRPVREVFPHTVRQHPP